MLVTYTARTPLISCPGLPQRSWLLPGCTWCTWTAEFTGLLSRPICRTWTTTAAPRLTYRLMTAMWPT